MTGRRSHSVSCVNYDCADIYRRSHSVSCVNYDCTDIYDEGMKEGRRVAKTSSILLKFEYVVVWGMGITELGTFLCVSKLVWVYESSEVLNFT